MTITATFVRFMSTAEFDNARLYKLSEAVPYGWCEPDEPDDRPLTDHVIVSAVNKPEWRVHETMIFPATHYGEVASWSELGCTVNITDHDQALRNMGYKVVIELTAFCKATGAQAKQAIDAIEVKESEDEDE